jgi:hypothetical protein
MAAKVKELKKGKYQHYEGKFYDFVGTARDSETLKEYVIYRALYDSPEFGKDALWIRPKEMFVEDVEIKGKKVPRFKYVG